MNLFSLLNELSTADAAAGAPRRAVLRQLGRAGGRALVAGLPALLAAPAAQAALAATTYDALVILLRVERLLVAFYGQARNSGALNAFANDINTLRTQKVGHVQFLEQALTSAGAVVPTAPTYDFSGQKNNSANPVLFPAVFATPAAFLNLAQQLEDASVGIYKGQAAQFNAGEPLLTAVLRMHTVAARHAAHVRTLRRASGARVKSWPSPADADLSPAVLVPAPPPAAPATVPLAAIEANITQRLGANLVPYPSLLTGATAVQRYAVAEAFDELLTPEQALGLLAIFS